MSTHRQPATDRTALVLSGGGARAAYQVGVLKAAAQLLPKRAYNPFSIITGTSAGAINAVALGASANNFRLAVKKVERVWTNLHVAQVYKTGYLDMLGSINRLMASLFHRGIGLRKPVSLLDSTPLAALLERVIDFDDLEKRLQGGQLDAIGITASCHNTGESVTFYQSDLEGRALRQDSPISPALHMGAERIMVVGVSNSPNERASASQQACSPSLARIVGHVFNSAFIDALQSNMDHLAHINELVGRLKNAAHPADTEDVKPVDFLCINPSIEIEQLVARHMDKLPRAVRNILNISGATPSGGGASLASYLLFEGEFCKELIDCGYRDAMTESDMLLDFFHPQTQVSLSG